MTDQLCFREWDLVAERITYNDTLCATSIGNPVVIPLTLDQYFSTAAMKQTSNCKNPCSRMSTVCTIRHQTHFQMFVSETCHKQVESVNRYPP